MPPLFDSRTSPRSPAFLGRGWEFPIRLRGGGTRLIDGPEKVRQSILLILSTAPGERPMRPDFGCGVHDLVFQPNTSTLRAQVAARVRDALLAFEPRIELVDVRVESPEEFPNHLLILIDYRLRTNNALFNMVYPFFLTEGAEA